MTTLERIALLRSQGAATITVHPDGSVTGGFTPLPPLRIVSTCSNCSAELLPSGLCPSPTVDCADVAALR